MQQKYRHQDTSFLISVEHISNISLKRRVYAALSDVFQGFIKTDNNDYSMSFFFTDNLDVFIQEKDFLRRGNILMGDKQVYFKDDEINFLINLKKQNQIYIRVKDNEKILSSLRIFNKSFKNNIELQATTFYYRIFMIFSQLWNLNNHSTYLHASGVEINGKSILFSADSGIGKSSLLLKLCEDSKYHFISDDMTIVSNKSKAFHQGRCLSIKPYHLKYFDGLITKFNNSMSLLQILQWKFLYKYNLTCRINPCNLFANISKSASIKRVIHLCNHNSVDFKIKRIDLNEYIRLSIPILENELHLANFKLNILASFPDSKFLSTNKVYSQTENILKDALRDVILNVVYVPYMSNPNDLYEFLHSKRCLS